MKKFSFLAFLGFLMMSSGAVAQNAVSISPNPVYVDGIAPNVGDAIGHSVVNNESSSELNFTWVRTVIEITEGWESAICDVNQCYLPAASSQSFDLEGNSEGTMDVHVYPNGVPGAAIIEIEVYETANPDDNKTTATYYFNQGTVGLVEKFSEAIKVYPNPTQDWISIDNEDNTVTTADLYDVKGTLLISSTVNGNQRFSVQELPAGNYILKMMDRDGKIISTNHLVKN